MLMLYKLTFIYYMNSLLLINSITQSQVLYSMI